ncbi:hypothetical protein HAX54_051852 [Datura stramonium]|uniref:Uncharacterized protein n=1 Tax=Datura stramonium TaxID=4076 RepID=A0ABS8WRU7_DATST|nr:hypothetical protein [Datura stramonium]
MVLLKELLNQLKRVREVSIQKKNMDCLLGSEYVLLDIDITYASFTGEKDLLLLEDIGHQIQNGLCNNFHKILSGTSSSIPRAHHAQLAWRSFLLNSLLYKGRTFSPLSRIAQAVGLALFRSFPIVPSIFALTSQKNIVAAETVTDMDLSSLKNAFYLCGHTSFTQLILSVFEGAILLVRSLYLVILFSPSIAMAPFADVLGPRFREIWLQVLHRTLERAGLAFIKWGQWAATRPYFFPRDLCAVLSQLHSKAPEHNFTFTKKSIEEAFGRKLSDISTSSRRPPLGPEV